MKLLSRLVVLLMLVLTPALAAGQALPVATPSETEADTPVELDLTGATAFASGYNTPAIYMDMRGNPIMAIAVTSVERDWENEGSYYSPAVGKDYAALNIQVVNLSPRPAVFSPYNVVLVDALGMVNEYAWIGSVEGVWTEDVTIPAGETVQGTIIFEMWADLDPNVVIWSPDYETAVIIYLGGE